MQYTVSVMMVCLILTHNVADVSFDAVGLHVRAVSVFGRNPIRLTDFWRISVRFCGFRTALSNKIFLNFLWYYNLCNKVEELVALLGEGICETSHGQFKCSSFREKALRPSRYDGGCFHLPSMSKPSLSHLCFVHMK